MDSLPNGTSDVRLVEDSFLSRDQKIIYLTTILTVSFVFTTCYYYFGAFYLKHPFPFNTYLVDGLFGDFRGSIDQWRVAAFSGVGVGMSYFPATYLFVDVFSNIFPHDSNRSAEVYVSLFAAFTLIYTFANVKTGSLAATLRDAAICSFLTYPFLFVVTTGNLEGIVFIFLALFVYFYKRGSYVLSAMALAICIAMKLFPAVFLVVFLADRRYRDFLYAIVFTIVLSLLPLLIFSGGILHGVGGYLDHFHASQKMYVDQMIISGAGVHFGHSLLGAVRALLSWHLPNVEFLLVPYLIITFFVFLLLSLYLIFSEKVFWKRIAVLTIAMCLLPYASTDYKLMHLLIPLYLFINYRPYPDEKSLDTTFIVLFGLLLVPKFTFIHLWGDPYDNLNIILTPLIMLALLALIIGSNLAMERRTAESLRTTITN